MDTPFFATNRSLPRVRINGIVLLCVICLSAPTIGASPQVCSSAIQGVIDEDAVKRLLTAVPAQYAEAYAFLIEEIRTSHIGFGEFRAQLGRSSESFVLGNLSVVQQGNFAAFDFSPARMKKSNSWCLSMLMEEGKELGPPIKFPAFRDFAALISHVEKRGIKDILIVDDASYSGTQLDGVLKLFADSQIQAKLQIHVVVPFQTKRAREILSRSRYGHTVKLYPSQHIPSFDEKIQTAVDEGRLTLQSAAYLRKAFETDLFRGVTFFDHKKPDFLSTVTARGSGRTVLDGIAIPTLEGGESDVVIPIVKPIHAPYGKDAD